VGVSCHPFWHVAGMLCLMVSTRAPHRRGFGNVRKLPSGRWQARYTGPDGLPHKAPITFTTKGDALTHLAGVHADISREVWMSPAARKATAVPLLASYAASWLDDRTLKPRTRSHYRKLLDAHILPTLGGHTLNTITPTLVRTWHAKLTTGPTAKAHAYSLLKTVMHTAVAEDIIAANPCRVRAAGQSKRVIKIKPASLQELTALVAAMPERYKAMVLLAAWCGLRFGELAALTRADLDRSNGVVHVRRAVVRVDGQTVLGTPKSAAGVRDVRIPPHLLPVLAAHVLAHAGPGRDGLLFSARTGGYLNPSALSRVFYPAREAAGRPDLRFHDLRHTGATLAAQTGATLVELMNRLGHSTAGAAMRYQHASADRDLLIAERLSALVEGRA